MQIDIWSDIACPWCYVGKRRLEGALAAFDRAGDVEVTWHSFELDPAAPAAYDGEYVARLASKYGRSPEEAAAMLAGMTEMAAAEGLELRFDRIRAGSTFDGHRLLHLALEEDLQGPMKERLMRGYLTEGELISDPGTLRRLALEVGLPEARVEELLAGDAFGEQVRLDEYTAQRLGIDAVPFFVFDRRLAVRGAQDSALLLQALHRAAGAAA